MTQGSWHFDVLETKGEGRDRASKASVTSLHLRDGVATPAIMDDREMTADIHPRPSSSGFIAMLGVYRATGGMVPGNFLCQSLLASQRGDLALTRPLDRGSAGIRTGLARRIVDSDVPVQPS